MGCSSSKPITTPVTVVKPVSPAVVHGNEDKTEETKQLVRNIRVVLEQMKEDVQSNASVSNGLFRSLFTKLESLNNILNPQRMHICYIVGGTCAGKSSLINSIVNIKDKCKVSHTVEPGTLDFEIIPVPEVNTIFVDTNGFGSNLDDSRLLSRFKTDLQTDNRPDSILLVVTPEKLRDRGSLKLTINYINKVIKYLENIRHNTSVPIICVLNKIDQSFPDGLSDSEDCRKKIEKQMQDALTIVNQFLKTKATQCVVTSTFKNYGIDELRCSINAQSPLNAQIIDKDLDYMKKHRWIIANKIIAAFSSASAAVSLIPLADIIIVTILQEWMYRMLACFSIDPNRTPDTFKTIHHTVQGASLVVRAGALTIGGVFQLTLIGYLVGSGICVAAAALSTAALGWGCYYYFIKETSPK